ncbi:MAG TPA: CNNM domain-containing protein [bacterium]|nr:CNNM domain-containing protein [bacterium]
MPLVDLFLIALMIACNAVFAAYEMALASISQSRIDATVAAGRPGAAEAAYMKGRMEASLVVIQLGITLVGAVAAAVGGAGVEQRLSPLLRDSWGLPAFLAEILGLVLLVIPLTFVTMTVGELIPKMLALRNKELMVLSLSPAMKRLASLVYPVVSLVEAAVTRAVGLISKRVPGLVDERLAGLYELRAAASLGRTSKLLGARGERIVLAAAHLSTHAVRDLMVPAADIYMIPRESSLADALVLAHMDMHTRFPVCARKGDPQTIEGYVNFKDIVMALRINPEDPTVRGITRPLLRLDGGISVADALERMMMEKAHIALIEGPGRVILGMLTLEDILEELVGEIEDEFDRAMTHVRPYGASWIMGGGVPMTSVGAALGLDWAARYPGGDVPTLSDWCAERAGGPLVGGECIEHDAVRVIPRKFRSGRMLEAIVSRIGSAGPPRDDSR